MPKKSNLPSVPKPLYVVVDPLASNSMKSANPHSGFHFEDIALCLDTSSQNPIRNGGGGMVIYKRTKARKSAE